MANSTYWGFPEIVWTAWEAIGTVLAVVLTLLILLGTTIKKHLFSPNIHAWNPEISYKRPQEHTATRGKIQLDWHIQNKPRYLFFGGLAVNLKTKFWFDKKEHEGWAYSGKVDPLPILPKNEKWKQHTKELVGELESSVYKLILVFYQEINDKEIVIGHAEFDIKYKVILHRII